MPQIRLKKYEAECVYHVSTPEEILETDLELLPPQTGIQVQVENVLLKVRREYKLIDFLDGFEVKESHRFVLLDTNGRPLATGLERDIKKQLSFRIKSTSSAI